MGDLIRFEPREQPREHTPRSDAHAPSSRIPGRTAPRAPLDEPEPLWRVVLGRRLRALRLERGQRLADTAGAAGISVQYLSEVERGLKEPSSEIVAAVAGALGCTLLDLTAGVSLDLRSRTVSRGAGPTAGPTQGGAPQARAA